MKYVEAVVMALTHNRAWMATKFVSEKETIRATQCLERGRVPRGSIDIRLHIGRPNYSERKFIRDWKGTGLDFPVKKIVLKFPPKRRS